MAREKQGEAAEKVMFMRKNQLKNSLFMAIVVALLVFAFLYLKGKSGENTT